MGGLGVKVQHFPLTLLVVSAVGKWKNQKKVVNMRQRSVANICVYISAIWGEETT